MDKKLYRDERRKVVAGVCAGLADYLNIDVSIVRLVFVLTLIFKGGGGLVYIILWIVLPKKEYTYTDPTVDYTVPPQSAFNAGFNNPAFNQPPFGQPPARRASTVGLIGGMVLIMFGVFFLLDEYDIFPDWDFDRLWPLVLVAIGAVLIFSGRKKQPWEHDNWQDQAKKDDTAGAANPSAEDHPIDNPPIV